MEPPGGSVLLLALRSQHSAVFPCLFIAILLAYLGYCYNVSWRSHLSVFRDPLLKELGISYIVMGMNPDVCKAPVFPDAQALLTSTSCSVMDCTVWHSAYIA